ncbi:hypothetical protein XI07_14600 [Bradyrhizobium sp. CCBAU 11445]|nr:hypothetical protein [Bradyrhizobium sp. CCBAU 25360]MDA9483232.1 hypothetical protein [Bradyrhizobium sp. CCBAU 11445]
MFRACLDCIDSKWLRGRSRWQRRPAVRYFKLEASLVMAEIELPDLRTTLVNCSSDSLSRLRRILTCTLSLKSSELRKWVGFDLFICFFRDEGMD